MFISHTARRSVISLSGKDRYNFLQGIITNDINKASPTEAIYSYILSPQGKFLYDLFIIAYQDKLLLDIPKIRKDEILEFFKKYKLRSEVEFVDLDEQMVVLSLINNDKKSNNIDVSQNIITYVDPRSKNLGIRAIRIIQKEIKEEEYYSSLSDYDNLRIRNFIPEGEEDMIYDKSFPVEYNAVNINAIDFNKGCYIGQEVTTRTWRRGVIRKKLYMIESKNNINAKKGDEILANETKIGIICSISKNIALSLIKEELLALEENSCNITINGIRIAVLERK